MNFFNELKHVNWPRVWLVAFAVGAGWGAMAAIIPPRLHIYVTSILGGFTVALGILIRGTKYIKDRQDIPPSGVTP
jgi:hypothetical protein